MVFLSPFFTSRLNANTHTIYQLTPELLCQRKACRKHFLSPPVPLSNAGSTCVGQDYTSNSTKDLRLQGETNTFELSSRNLELRHRYNGSASAPNTYISISFYGGTNLLGAGGNCELSFAFQAFIQSLLGHRGSATHVLVAGVGTAADQT